MYQQVHFISHLLEFVQLVAPQGEQQARGVVLLVGILQVARPGQYPQCAVHGHGEVLELAAEIFYVELLHAALPVAHGHLVVVLQMLIYIFYIIFLREVIRNAFQQGSAVRLSVEDDGIRLLAVAPGPSGLLEVGFNGVRQVHVDDEAHIGLVDAHAECISGHDDAAFAPLPTLLADVARGVVQSGMVEVGLDVGFLQ